MEPTTDDQDDQYCFWLGRKYTGSDPDLWKALHAHFEKQASGNGSRVEEVHTSGKAK